jgi:molybdopterin/thiamine biosynthesis adenylyltransferase
MTERYARQMVLAEVGAAGQQRLAGAAVLVVGAGGLGCPVLQYLAGAGVGRIAIVDHDRVEETNLHRQPLYSMADVGKLKAEAAAATLRRFNPDIRLSPVVERLTPQNVAALVAERDRRVDAADSFRRDLHPERRLPCRGQAAGQRLGDRHDGYAGAFCGGGPSYRAVFPEVSVDGGTCASVGVLGTAVAVLGGLQAHLACISCWAWSRPCWAG